MSLEDISYKELLLKIQTNKELGILYFKNLFNKYYKKFNNDELIIWYHPSAKFFAAKSGLA